jgi:hypothetical protein
MRGCKPLRLLTGIGAVCAMSFLTFQAQGGTLFTFNGFSSTTGLSVVGNASTAITGDGTVLRIVPSVGNQSGATYFATPITLGPGNSFSTQFQFRFTSPIGIDPADGIVFVIGTSTTGLGGLGFGMGYQGVSGNSIGIEFDTYNNAGNPSVGNNDGNSSNHVSIDQNGALNNNNLVNVYGNQSCGFPAGNPAQNNNMVPGCMSNGDLWTVNISYNGTALTVTLSDPAEGTTFTALNALPINIAAILGQNTAFVGFTGGTGSGAENEDIVNWTFSNAASITPAAPSATPAPATWMLMIAGLGLAGLLAWRLNRSAPSHPPVG